MKKSLIMFFIFCLFIPLLACHKESKVNDDDPIDENKPIDEDIINQRIDNILKDMTLEAKVGQMFMVGFSGTTVPDYLKQAIKKQYFGNFIYFGTNVTDAKKITTLSSTLQTQVMNTINIPAFISIDQEGGMIVRMQDEATHFIGNMGLTATRDSNNAFQVAQYSGQELRHFGINVNLAPSLDVNINPQNPVIGIRSYSDDPQVVTDYGLKAIAGYKTAKVMATVKHFPGHGDTVVDSHYGLPLITHDKTRLYDVELAPFIAAINNGVDAIMSAHIIFSAFDSELPATLSKKVITDLLRDELGFDGIIMTDEMQMNAIRNNFGIKDAAIKAIQAGVDILLYSDAKTNTIDAYNGVLNACQDGLISEERINASVKRILRKKYQYDLFTDYLPHNNLKTDDFISHQTYNNALVQKSVTLAKGKTDWFSKDKKTLLISPTCNRYTLANNYAVNSSNNSFAYVGKLYLESEGMKDVTSYVIDTSLKTNEITELVNMAQSYDQVIIAIENASSSQATLINRLSGKSFALLVVALQNPYDYRLYSNVSNYVCTYGYYGETVRAVMDLLLHKYSPSGVLPVKVTGLNA
jgi:beta-N-acetylhexosaminidase